MTDQAQNSGFARIGHDVVIHPFTKIVFPERVSIGDSVVLDDFVLLIGGKSTKIGSFVHIAAFTSIGGGGDLIMEDFAGLSGGIRVYTGNEDYLGGSLTNPAVPHPFRAPICSFVSMRRHSIVGANSVILPGVEIGEGAVVGANSLVTRDCEPWTIYAGSPAEPLHPRPRERILELERKLRSELYDAEGRYIPAANRDGG